MRLPLTMPRFIILLPLLLLLLVSSTTSHNQQQEEHDAELDAKEFRDFCEISAMARETPKSFDSEECSAVHPQEFDIQIDGKMLFTLIMIIAYGALLRTLIHNFEIHIPYTVILMLSGLILGYFSKKFCWSLHEYTAIARIPASVILYTFLPLLIFESAFNIPVHAFNKSVWQILWVAFPGMVFCTIITAGVCMHYYSDYKWNFHMAALFGSIISATDPVAVVSILRELGVSEVLSVMIEGESLLNDGVAILLYQIFEKIVETQVRELPPLPLFEQLIRSVGMFVQIAIGGPAFGWAMGKITIFLLSNVFNDAAVEISSTIVAAYVTYYLSEAVLEVSGVMAVVVLGITMRAQRTVISPESEPAVHHFWEITGFLANTVLFFLVGIDITETAIVDLNWNDMFNLVVLYVTIHVSRFIMLLGLYPILARTGYGITWQNMIIMMWGGLRGAVGMCLALDVARNPVFCDRPELGPKMLFLTAGIVFLTLVINGTTTRPLLSVLKLTEISEGRKIDMKNAVKRIRKLKNQAIRMFLLTNRMSLANWNTVNSFVTVKNPYTEERSLFAKMAAKAMAAKDTEASTVPGEDETKLQPPAPIKENTTVCPNCKNVVPNEPTGEEYFHLTEEGRLKVIRAMKISYTHRNSIGISSDLALQILMNEAERTEDINLQLICSKNFDKYTHTRGFYHWLNRKFNAGEGKEGSKIPIPKGRWRERFWKVATNEMFEKAVALIVLLNMIPLATELFLEYRKICTQTTHVVFLGINVLFTVLFTVELVVNVLGTRLREYFCDPWSVLDLIVLIIYYVDVIIDGMTPCFLEGSPLLKYFRLLRVSRIFRLLKSCAPSFRKFVQRKNDEQLFVGYDVGRAFVHASDEVLKFLPQMIENKKVMKGIKEHLERERVEGIKAILFMQRKHRTIANAVKTRQACRSVINAMMDTLHDMIDEGFLDEKEADVLTRILELKIKRLWHSPTSLPDNFGGGRPSLVSQRRTSSGHKRMTLKPAVGHGHEVTSLTSTTMSMSAERRRSLRDSLIAASGPRMR